jgi:hypothetical protein
MTLPALKSMAKERGLKRYSKLRKDELVKLLLENGTDMNESRELMAEVSTVKTSSPVPCDDYAQFLYGSLASPIAHSEQIELMKRQIEEHVTSSLSALLIDVDVCGKEEKAEILKQMLSCAEEFRTLTKRLKGSADELAIPISLLHRESKSDLQPQVTEAVSIEVPVESAEGSEKVGLQEQVFDGVSIEVPVESVGGSKSDLRVNEAISIEVPVESAEGLVLIDVKEQISNEVSIKVPVKRNKPVMSNDELSCYLESRVTDEHCYKVLMCSSIDKVGNDLEGIAKQLKDTSNRVDGSILQIYYVFGNQLDSIKGRFDKLKSTEGVKEKWGEWVKKNAGISGSHCCKIRAVAALMKKFPRLQNLTGISFTQLYNLRKNIVELFTDAAIAKKWSKKMIYEDELCRNCNDRPFEPSFFVPCGHGVDYCESCMARLMKDSTRREEYEVDGEMVDVDVVVPGCICPECRGKIKRIAYNRPTIIGAQVQRTVYLRPLCE